MCQLCVDACVADRQEQGGTRGRENEVGGEKKKKRGRAQDSPSGIRTSLDCSAAAGAQPTRRETAQGTGTQSLQHSLLSCRDARARVQLLSCLGRILEVAFCFGFFFFFFSGCTTLWQWSSMTGRSAVCPNAARRAVAGYATGEEVRSGRRWPGARSREVGWGAHMELCAAFASSVGRNWCKVLRNCPANANAVSFILLYISWRVTQPNSDSLQSLQPWRWTSTEHNFFFYHTLLKLKCNINRSDLYCRSDQMMKESAAKQTQEYLERKKKVWD